jgi:hypothetical protein
MSEKNYCPEKNVKKEMQGLPPVGVNVIVQCAGLRCMAYRTVDGKWVTTFTSQELKNVIAYFPLG